MSKLCIMTTRDFATKAGHILFLLLMPFISTPLLACTAFCFQAGDQVLVGKSYDWMLDDGYIMVNKREMAKTALISITQDKPAQWVSKYGSVTFNQYGREFPIGGMNEKGLVIESLVNFNTQYPPADKRPAVNVLSWVQYCLDTCSNTREVIDCQKNIRIAPQFAIPLHFMVSDPNNNAITVEFINGQTRCTPMETAPTKILTNSHYKSCLDRLSTYQGFGGSEIIPAKSERQMSNRFVVIADRFKKFMPDEKSDKRSNLLFGMGTLQIARAYNTQWQILYDLTHRTLYYRRTRQRPGTWQTIECNAFSYAGDTPVMALDMKKPAGGNVTKDFVNYTTDLNRKLVFHTIKKTPSTRFASDAIINQIVQYPETTTFQPMKKVTKGNKQ